MQLIAASLSNQVAILLAELQLAHLINQGLLGFNRIFLFFIRFFLQSEASPNFFFQHPKFTRT